MLVGDVLEEAGSCRFKADIGMLGPGRGQIQFLCCQFAVPAGERGWSKGAAFLWVDVAWERGVGRGFIFGP